MLQAYGARSSRDPADSGAATLHSTVRAALTPAFLAGMVLDGLGFLSSLVSARLIPLFLSQTIISANLVVTALLGVAVLGVRLRGGDWLAIGTVVVSLVVLGFTTGHLGTGTGPPWLHWALLVAALVILAGGVMLARLLGARAAIPAGLIAGVLYGTMAVAVRVADGLDPFRVGALLTDPAAWTVAIAGIGGFYLFTVALQLGSVNGAAAALVVGETVIPGILGILLFGDTARPGFDWLLVVAFCTAVAGAVAVAGRVPNAG
ncbi:putative integral membrane protein [Mycolicibacterium canariasense]|uniref:Putative integral membrane protein n=1 Tax=Mycolicibacterium canariasense TaxID=228230 RepID=A0A124E2S9_MYCCR|nr:putative integral membrane protein [Mycolicibacterium canariasense]